MKEFTVIGVWEDNGDVFTQRIQYLPDAQAAVREAVKGADNPETLIIVGVIEGSHIVITPDEDNWKSAYAIDLQGKEAS